MQKLTVNYSLTRRWQKPGSACDRVPLNLISWNTPQHELVQMAPLPSTLSTIYYLLTPRELLPVRGRQQRHGHAVSPPLRVRPRPRHQQQRVRLRSLRGNVDKYGKYLLRKIFSPIKYLHYIYFENGRSLCWCLLTKWQVVSAAVGLFAVKVMLFAINFGILLSCWS